MSAFILNDEVFVNLASVIADNIYKIKEIANVLKEENYKSVNYRYNDQELYTECADEMKIVVLSPIKLLNLAHCYDYQSCEHPDYLKSQAYIYYLEIVKEIANQIKNSNVEMTIEYNNAGWGNI